MSNKLISALLFLTISSVFYGQSPYNYIGDESKTLQGFHDNIAIPFSIIGVLEDSTMVIAKFNYITRVIDYEDFEGKLLSSDTLSINAKAFTTIDPNAAEMPWVSPYSFCFANPTRFIDPTGCSPIYSTTGEFLGTDDNGLQGEFYIIEAKNFTQGMSTDDIQKYAIQSISIPNDILNNIKTHYNTLPERPDYDGYLTLEEANAWYQKGNGQPLFVNLSLIDLSGIVSLGENYVGQKKTFNLLTGASGSLNDGLVYGNITLKRYPNNTVRAFSDMYDFDMKPWSNPFNWPRNLETIIGNKVAGNGTPYEINIFGSAPLKPIFPWVK